MEIYVTTARNDQGAPVTPPRFRVTGDVKKKIPYVAGARLRSCGKLPFLTHDENKNPPYACHHTGQHPHRHAGYQSGTEISKHLVFQS